MVIYTSIYITLCEFRRITLSVECVRRGWKIQWLISKLTHSPEIQYFQELTIIVGSIFEATQNSLKITRGKEIFIATVDCIFSTCTVHFSLILSSTPVSKLFRCRQDAKKAQSFHYSLSKVESPGLGNPRFRNMTDRSLRLSLCSFRRGTLLLGYRCLVLGTIHLRRLFVEEAG